MLEERLKIINTIVGLLMIYSTGY